MHGMNNIKFTQGIHCCFTTVTKTGMFHEETSSDFMNTRSTVFHLLQWSDKQQS